MLTTFLFSTLVSLSSFYSLQFTDIDGNTIHLADYQGKKILFVNTASYSLYTSQYAQLEQLYQQYHDSLIVIAFPSNSFGSEPAGNEEIKSFIAANYNVHFIVASKTDVSGENISPIYQWLTKAIENGSMENNVDADFYKYLVNENGMLVAAFGSAVDPMSDELKNVVEAW